MSRTVVYAVGLIPSADDDIMSHVETWSGTISRFPLQLSSSQPQWKVGSLPLQRNPLADRDNALRRSRESEGDFELAKDLDPNGKRTIGTDPPCLLSI